MVTKRSVSYSQVFAPLLWRQLLNFFFAKRFPVCRMEFFPWLFVSSGAFLFYVG